MSHGQNMMCFTTYWGEHKTFKLMPISEDCPFLEAIYDPNVDMLVAISKNMKQNLQMVPKLDENGNVVKASKPKNNGKPFKEKQILMDVPQEFYFVEREEQVDFIKKFAVNAEAYDYQEYFTSLEQQMKEKVLIEEPEKPGLVNENGQPLKAVTD